MLKLRPPTHKIDQGGVFVSMSDCWDTKALNEEARIRKEKALADKRETLQLEEVELSEDEEIGVTSHSPWSRYYLGKTRYQLDAPDHDATGKPVTVREYLLEGQKPTEFVIRRLDFQTWRDISSIIESKKALLELCALGLKEIRGGTLPWKLEKGQDRVPDDILQSLHEAHPGLISEIGLAVSRYNQPLTDEEKKA